MKITFFYKARLVFAFVLGTAFSLQAQEGFKMGIQAGLPFNDFNEALSDVVGADASYMYPLGEVVDIGPSVGIIHGFAETFQSNIVRADLESVQFCLLYTSDAADDLTRVVFVCGGCLQHHKTS